MPNSYLRKPKCFLTKSRTQNITIELISPKEFKKWLSKQDKVLKKSITESSFEGKQGQVYLAQDKKGQIKKAIAGSSDPFSLYDFSHIANKLKQHLSAPTLKKASFSIKASKNAEQACIGWAIACYNFDNYKDNNQTYPSLVWPKGVNKTRVNSTAEAIYIIRDLVNTPANDMGPAELEKASRELAKNHKATIKVTGDKVLKTDFPLIFAVGDSSPRRPRLIDIKWGNPKHPKVTLVGKGVCFDTGGLDLKPSQYMALMKKDMAGAAHVLALARMIMGIKLPIRLRVLIPAVENSVSGCAFRPGDVFNTRKGLKVENKNTDAEGRLILADALTYACEEKPDLVIDFCTLTGSARAALGPDIPAIFSNMDKIGDELEAVSYKSEDPLWRMPLWQPYRKMIESDIGDIVNSAGVPGDLIYSALFLESFLKNDTDWIHLDIFSWTNSGKPGRPKGAADTGMRAVFSYLEKKYS